MQILQLSVYHLLSGLFRQLLSWVIQTVGWMVDIKEGFFSMVGWLPLGHDHLTQIFRVQTGTCIIMVHGLLFSGERDVCKNSMKDSSQIIMLTTNKHYKGPRGVRLKVATHIYIYIVRHVHTHTHTHIYIYMWASALCIRFTIIPPRLTDQCNFITILLVTREPEQTTLLFWSHMAFTQPTGDSRLF